MWSAFGGEPHDVAEAPFGRLPCGGRGFANSDAMSRRHRNPTVEAQPSYEAWKAVAAEELKRLHGIEATAIAEREWTKLYVRGLAPEEAAERAERESRNTRPASSLTNK
jgi:hypothetical protein